MTSSKADWPQTRLYTPIYHVKSAQPVFSRITVHSIQTFGSDEKENSTKKDMKLNLKSARLVYSRITVLQFYVLPRRVLLLVSSSIRCYSRITVLCMKTFEGDEWKDSKKNMKLHLKAVKLYLLYL